MRIGSLILVVCAAVAAGSCQSKQPEPAAPAADQPPYTTTATVKDIMLHIVDPAGDMVWDSVATVIDKGGIHETAPKTDEEWFKVRSGLIMLIEGSNLLMIPGRKVARPGREVGDAGRRARAVGDGRVDRQGSRRLEPAREGRCTTSRRACCKSSRRRTRRSCSTSARTSTGRARTATGSTGIRTRRFPISPARSRRRRPRRNDNARPVQQDRPYPSS